MTPIEHDLEKRMMEKIAERLDAAGVPKDDCQIIGAWQADDAVKGVEDDTKIYIVVKTYPRTYDTPTIPDCQIQNDITLLVRSDVDYKGRDYLGVTGLLTDLFQRWQGKHMYAYADLNLPGRLELTGCNITSGDVSLDRENALWRWDLSFAVYGIVQDV